MVDMVYLRAHAAENQLDPTHFAIWGGFAGGIFRCWRECPPAFPT